MSDFKSRLLDEQSQLGEKISKLDEFIPVMDNHNVEQVQQELLKKQLVAMKAYKAILDERIKLLGL